MNTEEKTLIVEKSNLEVFVARNLVLITMGISIFLAALSFAYIAPKSGFQSTGLYVAILMALLLIVMSMIVKKFLHGFLCKIVFNEKEERIVLYPMIENPKLSTDYSYTDLTKVYVNLYVNLIFKDGRYRYNDLSNANLFFALREISTIHWGPLTTIFGPPKKFIEKLENESNHDFNAS